MTRPLDRLLRPKSIALFGGGWAQNVLAQLLNSGFAGDIWPVHPKREMMLGLPCYASIEALPGAPDAAFVGVNRETSVDIVGRLAKMGAGGATCFASGFLESDGEETGGGALQRALVEAAGDMPILGPNCYGLLNYLDNATLWPDQHGGVALENGIGIIAQSSNIAINMTMQARNVPIGYVVAAGNQAQTGIADLAEFMLADDRITAIGLYLEGFGDLRRLEAFAGKAKDAGKPVVVLKIGKSEKARAASVTHTASLAGGAAASSALIKRLGFVEVHSIAVFLETLKLLHGVGPLPGNSICSISCSGGEASLMADLAASTTINFREFSQAQGALLKQELGPLVTIANPLDYHTFIWGDTPRMTRVFCEVMRDAFDLCVFVLDIPRDDRCDPSSFQCAVDAIIAAQNQTGARVAVLTSLPENLSERWGSAFIAAGIVPLHGMEEGLAAIDAAATANASAVEKNPLIICVSNSARSLVLNEAEAKEALAGYGLKVPASREVSSASEATNQCSGLTYPVALKGLNIAHKSETGAVLLNLRGSSDLAAGVDQMPDTCTSFLVEEMVDDGIAELLVGITKEPTGLLLLTLGAGGVLTELLSDTAHLILPAGRNEIRSALERLKLAKILKGYRGKPAADLVSLLEAIEAICNYAVANSEHLLELDVNPLIVREGDAIAVDALIRLEEE